MKYTAPIIAVVLVALIAFFSWKALRGPAAPIVNDNGPIVTDDPAISRRATLTGQYVCLPHKNTTGPQTLECAFGMKADTGDYYGVSFNMYEGTQPNINTGERFTANGLVTPVEALSSDHWQKYNIKGIFSVTDSFVKLSSAQPTAPATSTPTTAGIPNLITVDNPKINQKISSPIVITGRARGTWYFEASFPVELKDASGKTIAQHYAEAQSEWMTENFVNFKSTLNFPAQPTGSKGTLILHKDNPSGDPIRDQSVSIPVTF